MKSNAKKIIAVLLTAAMLLSTVCVFAYADEGTVQPENVLTVAEEDIQDNGLLPYLTAGEINRDELSNSVVIPGVFQSRTLLYNDDGTVATNSDGEELSAPFFLDSTGDIVKFALKKILFPLLVTLLTQHDFGGRLAKGFGEGLGEILGGKIASDANGKFLYNVRADKYEGSVATLTEEQKAYIYDQIPLTDYAQVAGEDHLYFFSYASFGNINDIVDELYELIVKAANESPTGKANIIPISQGGSLANDLLNRHKDVGQYLDRIIYIVPALDGTILLGEIFENGIIDDDESLYKEILPILVNDDDNTWLGQLITIALRLFPNKVINNMLDEAVDSLIGSYIKNSTCMWALVSSANYPAAAEKYLSGEENRVIRAQTDEFYNGQINSNANITYQMETYGVEVFDIVDYNYSLYPIVDSWKTTNGDGIIHVSSTSMGATSFGVDVTLPSDYTPAFNGKYVDKYNIIDAGTGLLPDQTFYFHNQNHEHTANNDVIMKLAICLLTDNEFTSVDSYPEQYPQFNEARDSKHAARDLNTYKSFDLSGCDESVVAEYNAALEGLEAELNNTIVDTERFDNARQRMKDAYDLARGIEKEEESPFKAGISNAFANTVIKISDFLYKILGGKGFSDIFRIF